MPIGQTPIVATTGTRHSIIMISAVTAKGAIHFTTFAGKMNANVFITYCQDLLHDDGGIAFREGGREVPVVADDGRVMLVSW